MHQTRDVPAGTLSPKETHVHRSHGHHDHARRRTQRAIVARSRARLRRPVHGRARRIDRERGAAIDPARPSLQHLESAMGGQRLHADLRRLPPPRRPRRRPLRAAPHLLGGTRRLHRLEPVRRIGAERSLAGDGPSDAGARCGHPRPGHPHHPHRQPSRRARHGPGPSEHGARWPRPVRRPARCSGASSPTS